MSVLTQEEVNAIREASLQILDEVGILITEPKGIDLLLQIGCRSRNGRVLIPPAMVEKFLDMCPEEVTLCGRGNQRVIIGKEKLCWHNLGGAREVYEPTSNSRRPAMVEDVKRATRLLDALDSASTITPFFTPQDVPGKLMSLAMYRYTLPMTTKPVQGPGVQSPWEVDAILKMAEVIGDPCQVLSLSVSPISPLRFPDQAVQSIFLIAQNGIPFAPLPCPTAGTTAPITLAGALAQQNAEVLACIVLAQAIHPGLPVIYCGRLAMMEPRTGASVWGGVELGLASAATVQIAHAYGLPVNVYGFSTNSHRLELQNGYERAINALLPALAGADEISGIGELEAGVAGAFAQMVIDDEIAVGIRRICRGIGVNDETIAFGVIRDVIDRAGNFLVENHTRRFLRNGELLITRLAERGSWETWTQSGYKDMVDRAQEFSEVILSKHEVPPLERAQEEELDRILYASIR